MGLRTIKESQRRERMRKSPRGFSGLFLQYWLAATFTRSHRQRSIGFSHRKHEKSSELFARVNERGTFHLALRSLSNSDSVRMVTSSSLALSHLEPGSVPTTT